MLELFLYLSSTSWYLYVPYKSLNITLRNSTKNCITPLYVHSSPVWCKVVFQSLNEHVSCTNYLFTSNLNYDTMHDHAWMHILSTCMASSCTNNLDHDLMYKSACPMQEHTSILCTSSFSFSCTDFVVVILYFHINEQSYPLSL